MHCTRSVWNLEGEQELNLGVRKQGQVALYFGLERWSIELVDVLVGQVAVDVDVPGDGEPNGLPRVLGLPADY